MPMGFPIPAAQEYRQSVLREAHLQVGAVLSDAGVIDALHHLSLPRIHHRLMPGRCMNGQCSSPRAAWTGLSQISLDDILVAHAIV